LPFSTPCPVCVSKVTQAEATGMHVVHDKQRVSARLYQRFQLGE